MLMELSRPAPLAARQLAGRVAVVTGSSGIGLGVRRAFGQTGAAIVLNGLISRERGRGLDHWHSAAGRRRFDGALTQ